MLIKTFNQLVSEMVAHAQASSNSLIRFSPGSILRAVIEAVAGVLLWLQSLVMHVLAKSRASTSTGGDLDSWMADFGLTRLPPINASCSAMRFSRNSAEQEALIPVDATVESSDGTKKYSVVADNNNSDYDPNRGGYVIPVGILSMYVPVRAITEGSAGNAAVGEVDTLTTAIPGVDAVTNTAAITDGLDAETDSAFRERFRNTMKSLSKATEPAIAAAISAVRPGLGYNIVENYNFDGSPNDGYFYVVVDDGTGYPSQQIIYDVAAAIDECRPLTSTFEVYAPQIINADVTFDIETPSPLLHTPTINVVKEAVIEHINGLGLGKPLSITRLAKVIYDASPNVLNVSNMSINLGTYDLVPTSSQVLKPGILVVN